MKVNLLCNEKLTSSKLKFNNSLKSFKIITNNNDLLENDYYFILKKCELSVLKELKKKNNYIILEHLDFNWRKSDCILNNLNSYLEGFNEIIENIDLLICSNNHIKSIFENRFKNINCVVNYHEYDERIKCTNVKNDNIYYFGDLKKSSLDNKIIKNKSIKVLSKIKPGNFNSSIHIDFVLSNNIQYHIHTSTKLATALNLNSVFICNKQPIYIEILGHNYPLYIYDDLSNLDDVIILAKNIINSKEKYKEYLEYMKKFKLMLTPEKIKYEYEKIFSKINSSFVKYESNEIKNYFFNISKTNLIHKWIHYLDIYDNHFKKFKNKNPTILEIGIYEGGSLEMWNYYFNNNCTIYGIYINKNCIEKVKSLKKENIKPCIGDQGSRKFWREFLKDKPKFDIVIDDGSHKMEDQKITFQEVYDNMSENGIYLCEDLHTSYWERFNSCLKNKNSFIEYSKDFIDMLNYYHIENFRNMNQKKMFKKFRNSTDSVHFYDSIVVLERKKLNEEPTHKKMI
jgi:hypothetical protein